MTRAVLALALLTALVACGEADDAVSRAGQQTTLTVLAAASLTEVFTDLAEDYEAAHEGVDVELSFGSSTELAETAADGAPGDVLATADVSSMQVAVEGGVIVEEPRPFATNEVVIVTTPGNPDGISSLADLEGTTWVRCDDDVPCGRVALTLLAAEGVTAEPVSLEADVRGTLEKVTSGEAEAGLVYASDAAAAGDAVETVPIAGAEEALTTYLVAPLSQSGHPALAADWVELVTSEGGRSALTAAGFTVP